MRYCVFSPCLIKTKSEDFCSDMKAMEVFDATVKFISQYLNLELIVHKSSIFYNLHPYMPPFKDHTLSSFYVVNIMNTLQSILATSQVVDNIKFNTVNIDSSYVVVDKDEVVLMCESICQNYNDIIMFVGWDNFSCNDKLSIAYGDSTYSVNVIKDVWFDTSDILDNIIKIDFSKGDIFPNRKLCIDLCNGLPKNRDASIYHQYGQIIANRNGFDKMRYNSKWYKANAPHYCRKDNKFAIVLDDVHGTFEVFDYTKREPEYLGEYRLNGTLLESKSSSSQTHKFYG